MELWSTLLAVVDVWTVLFGVHAHADAMLPTAARLALDHEADILVCMAREGEGGDVSELFRPSAPAYTHLSCRRHTS